MTTQVLIKLDSSAKDKLSFLAKKDGENVNSVVRQLIDEYIKKKDISAYIDEIWNRIGKSMTELDVKPTDIQKAIKFVRRAK